MKSQFHHNSENKRLNYLNLLENVEVFGIIIVTVVYRLLKLARVNRIKILTK